MDRSACFDVPKHHRTLWREYAAGTLDAPRVAAAGDKRVAGFAEGYLPELYHRLYAEVPTEVPHEARGRAAAVRAKLHDLASELPEFETLRKQTTRDPLWAGMAACALADSVARTMPEGGAQPDADRARSILEGMRALAEANPGAFDEDLATAEGAAAGSERATLEKARDVNETAVRSALRTAIEEAGKAIDEAKAAATTFGCGGGDLGVRMDPGVALEVARRVRSSETLKRIVELAGRLTMTARAKRAARSEYARSELVGVEQTGHLSRILPTELLGLATPLGTASLYRRLLERSALGYKMSGKEREAKGPIIILIDQSGSMTENDKDAWSKAVALALLDAARSAGRAFGIVLYDDAVVGTLFFADPSKADPRQLLDMLSMRPSGGTNFAPAVRTGLDWIEGAGTFAKADLVHITDGAASDVEAEEARARAKKLGAHIYGIAIGGGGLRSLTAWSDEVAAITDVSTDTAAVNLIFDSI